MISCFQALLSIATCATAVRRLVQVRALGGAVQVNPGFSQLTRAWFQALNPKCEESLSNVAFNCNLRHYIKGHMLAGDVDAAEAILVGRCSLTPS